MTSENLFLEIEGFNLFGEPLFQQPLLKEIYESIVERIKNTYFIIYDSPKFADGSEREVLVKTRNPDALELHRRYISKIHSSEILWH